MSTRVGTLSRDPNVCASCSSLSDGMLDDVAADAARRVEQEVRSTNVPSRLVPVEASHKEKVLTNQGS